MDHKAQNGPNTSKSAIRYQEAYGCYIFQGVEQIKMFFVCSQDSSPFFSHQFNCSLDPLSNFSPDQREFYTFHGLKGPIFLFHFSRFSLHNMPETHVDPIEWTVPELIRKTSLLRLKNQIKIRHTFHSLGILALYLFQ